MPTGSPHTDNSGDGGIGTELNVDGSTDFRVKWTRMTSGDGAKIGEDIDGIGYVKDAVLAMLDRFRSPNKRIAVLWSGGSTGQEDIDTIEEYMTDYLDDKGLLFNDIVVESVIHRLGISDPESLARADSPLWWRLMNRLSKALAASVSGGTAYVFSNNHNCRTIFSPPSQHPQDVDPEHGGQATNGEIWHYAELPMLMRNLKIDRIVTFGRSQPGGEIEETTQWDITRVSVLNQALKEALRKVFIFW
ncbi:hypothetical protein ACLMJK_000009 [Lecanora helva]